MVPNFFFGGYMAINMLMSVHVNFCCDENEGAGPGDAMSLVFC